MLNLNLSQKEFKLFKELIYNEIGISLGDHKVQLVKSRLAKRIRKLGLGSFKEYYELIHNDKTGQEIINLTSVITTNVTSFFRETGQWTFLEKAIPKMLENRPDKKLRIWSAACSSGEEPYSIGIFLHNILPDIDKYDIKILATDISKNILKTAINGVYHEEKLEKVDKKTINKYFTVHSKDPEVYYQINNKIKNMVMFRIFNLVYDNFDIIKNKLDIIFCRNVMIYFDDETKFNLVNNLGNKLKNDGFLLVGHSENILKYSSKLKNAAPSVYKVKGG